MLLTFGYTFSIGKHIGWSVWCANKWRATRDSGHAGDQRENALEWA